MIYYLIVRFLPNFKETPLRLFQYVTVRAALCAITAFLLALLLGPLTVRLLKNFTAPNRYKEYVENVDAAKDKTPTMGGLLIIGSIAAALLLWSNLANPLVLVFLCAMIGFSAVGFIDDYLKVKKQNKDGISGKCKMLLLTLISLGALYCFSRIPSTAANFQELCIPLLKAPLCNLPVWATFIFGCLVVVGSSNAVNLTDGRDGLAVGCMIFCALTYAVFAYVSGNSIYADYLNIHYIKGAGDIGVFACCVAGACIGFLWHNCHPASMFMGDTGSLALGGCIGLISVMVKQEIVLLIVGWVFVMEAGSVMLQVASYKLFKKRIFLCAPIHHHFEKLGWVETKLVVRFWIIAGICALIGLATLKLR